MCHHSLPNASVQSSRGSHLNGDSLAARPHLELCHHETEKSQSWRVGEDTVPLTDLGGSMEFGSERLCFHGVLMHNSNQEASVLLSLPNPFPLSVCCKTQISVCRLSSSLKPVSSPVISTDRYLDNYVSEPITKMRLFLSLPTRIISQRGAPLNAHS